MLQAVIRSVSSLYQSVEDPHSGEVVSVIMVTAKGGDILRNTRSLDVVSLFVSNLSNE
jgi:hypothetical protein